jgi:DNA-binding NtrC family response regulator
MAGECRASVLIAEDDPRAGEALREMLTDEGYLVCSVTDGSSALALLQRESFDVLIADIRMPGADGLTLTREAKAQPDAPVVLVMTAYGTSSLAIEAMRAGAYDYLTKPLRFDELLIQLERGLESRRQSRELASYQELSAAAPLESELVGDSPAMQQLYKLIGQVAASDSTVLIRGESGTGKELVARAIHRYSQRSGGPFVAVNCAAIPDALLESELFGYERGAFTGALSRRRGRFELAQNGTVFLDEIGELSPALQAKLLRVLQDRRIERLGSETTVQLNVRIVAASNRDLEEMVASREFREDLYYRLNVVALQVPPLRERKGDIPVLSAYLLARAALRNGISATPQLSPDALEALEQSKWPGNVRELENVLERALVLSRDGIIRGEDMAQPAAAGSSGWCDDAPLERGWHSLIRELERSMVERALKAAGGNRSRAAAMLGINRRLLYEKMREFGLEDVR